MGNRLADCHGSPLTGMQQAPQGWRLSLAAIAVADIAMACTCLRRPLCSCICHSHVQPSTKWIVPGSEIEHMKKTFASGSQSASELISAKIVELGDWRGDTLKRIRKLIKDADLDVVEESQWMGTPVWSHDGIICTGESCKKAVNLSFAKGASLSDPAGFFNSSLDGNTRRAIDISEGQEVDGPAFKTLVRLAVELNRSGKSKPSKRPKP